MRASFDSRGSQGTIINSVSDPTIIAVDIPADLESTLAAKAPEPYDIHSFSNYCKTVMCEENLKFILYIRNSFKSSNNAAEYQRHVLHLIEIYIQPSAPLALNLSDSVQRLLLQEYERKVQDAKVRSIVHFDQPHLLQNTGKLDLQFFDATYATVYRYVELAFSRYRKLQDKMKNVEAIVCERNTKLAKEHQYAARNAALWWRNKITLKEFFSFPDPGLLDNL
jgi:hypothetical protein